MQLRRFLFSHLGFCILRASISYVYQWSINFKVHKTIHMSENIQNIVFEVLNSKMPKSLIFSGFLSIFTPRAVKMYFLGILDICQLVWSWKLRDHCSAHQIVALKMQKSKIDSKNCVRCIFSSFFSIICVF